MLLREPVHVILDKLLLGIVREESINLIRVRIVDKASAAVVPSELVTIFVRFEYVRAHCFLALRDSDEYEVFDLTAKSAIKFHECCIIKLILREGSIVAVHVVQAVER